MENGTKEIQLEALSLMGKVHMKLAAFKLEKPPTIDDN
jgi:hypothetical protein